MIQMLWICSLHILSSLCSHEFMNTWTAVSTGCLCTSIAKLALQVLLNYNSWKCCPGNTLPWRHFIERLVGGLGVIYLEARTCSFSSNRWGWEGRKRKREARRIQEQRSTDQLHGDSGQQRVRGPGAARRRTTRSSGGSDSDPARWCRFLIRRLSIS